MKSMASSALAFAMDLFIGGSLCSSMFSSGFVRCQRLQHWLSLSVLDLVAASALALFFCSGLHGGGGGDYYFGGRVLSSRRLYVNTQSIPVLVYLC